MNGVLYPDLSTNKVGAFGRKSQFTAEIEKRLKRINKLVVPYSEYEDDVRDTIQVKRGKYFLEAEKLDRSIVTVLIKMCVS